MDGISQVTSDGGLGPAQPVRPVEQSRVERTPAATAAGPIPKTPPSEVLEALDVAQRVLQELSKAQTTLRIDLQSGPGGKQLHIQVLDGNGDLVREIPPRRLAAVLAGEGTAGLVVDEKG
jgi:hypothetical protein